MQGQIINDSIIELLHGLKTVLKEHGFEFVARKNSTDEVKLVFALFPSDVKFNNEITCDVYTEIVTASIRNEDTFEDLYRDEGIDDHVDRVLRGCEKGGFFSITPIDRERSVLHVEDVFNDAKFSISVEMSVHNGGRVQL